MKTKFFQSFTFRIFVVTSLIIFLSLVSLTALNCYTTARRETSQQIHSGTNTLNQTASFIQYRVHAIEGIMNVICYDETIQTVLSYRNEYYSKNIANWNIHTTNCREILYNSYTTDNIDEIRLYSSSGPASFEETNEFKRLSSATQTEWYERLNSSEESSLWLPGNFFDDGADHILYVKKIADLQRLGNYLGYVTASIPVAKIADIVDQGELTVNTCLVVMNSHDEIIASTNNLFEETSDVRTLIESGGLGDSDALTQTAYRGEQYLMGYRDIPNSDWVLVMMVPYRDVLATIWRFLKQMILSVGLVILICLPIMYKLSESLNSRIVILKDMMQQSSAGNFLTEPIENGRDEIGELTNSFYQMQTKISKLVEDQYRLGYEIKDLEFQVLQSQINPHFLYNTLDMIHWMGLKHHCIEVSEAAGMLGEFYSLSLGHGETIVPILDELRHIQAYVHIQNMRFENRITFFNEVPPELYDYYMIKIVLQPIVENAISHGILEREDETGTITVRGEMEGKVIRLSVSDNGVGIPKERLEKILEKDAHQKKHGYGVWNIHQRLRLAYGEGFGLAYQSEVGVGTTVTVTLPAMGKPEG
ncbi:MAG: sensor histidine kinase [Eubacteriales bacterium]|nr:sensor histidine kinase [Eubacteriales bacterium]